MACEKYGFSSLYPLEPDVERMMDNSKVSDHHAIIPTAELKAYELQELSQKGNRTSFSSSVSGCFVPGRRNTFIRKQRSLYPVPGKIYGKRQSHSANRMESDRSRVP